MTRSPIFQYARDLYREMRQEFDLVLEAAYAAAEAGSHGAMLNHVGRRKGIDPYSLLTGPWSRVVKYAAPELIEWFEVEGRPSPARFEREWFANYLAGVLELPDVEELPDIDPAEFEHWQAQAASCKEVADHLWSVIRKARAVVTAPHLMDETGSETLNAVFEVLKEADH